MGGIPLAFWAIAAGQAILGLTFLAQARRRQSKLMLGAAIAFCLGAALTLARGQLIPVIESWAYGGYLALLALGVLCLLLDTGIRLWRQQHRRL